AGLGSAAPRLRRPPGAPARRARRARRGARCACPGTPRGQPHLPCTPDRDHPVPRPWRAEMTDTAPRTQTDQQPGFDGPLSAALVGTRRFFTRGEVSDDQRSLSLHGGRQGDSFYRDRWSHDKVVRSTHGVNCTGSCSWKVYVKDGIITWEAQQTDYPSTGGDRPEY